MQRKSSTRRTIRITRYRGRHLRPAPRRKSSTLLPLVATFLASLLLLPPAAAHHRDGHDGGRGQGPGQTQDNGSSQGQRQGKGKGASDEKSRASVEDTGVESGRTQDAADAREGNVSCPSGTVELKIDRAPSPGTFSDGTLVVTITAATATAFDWTSNITVEWVLVKGGPVTEVHEGGTSGTASAPFNPNSGSLYGISHVSFCYVPPGVIPEEIVDLFPDVPPEVPPEDVEAEIVPPGPPDDLFPDVPPEAVPPDDVLAEEIVAPEPPEDEVLAMRVAAPEAPAVQPAEEAEPAPALPATGSELLPFLLVALMLLGMGLLLVRRRGIRDP